MNRVVYIPSSRETMRAVFSGEMPKDMVAFTANSDLAESFGIDESDTEEAEFAALSMAALFALTHFGQRIVLVAEVSEVCCVDGEVEAANGGIALKGASPQAILAFFTEEEEPNTAALAHAAAKTAAGLSLDDAWELPVVVELIDKADLLWHDVTELPSYLGL